MKFFITGEYIQLNSLLKVIGLCDSGGVAKRVIDDGLVLVNGDVELRRRYKVREGDIVKFNGEEIEIVENGLADG